MQAIRCHKPQTLIGRNGFSNNVRLLSAITKIDSSASKAEEEQQKSPLSNAATTTVLNSPLPPLHSALAPLHSALPPFHSLRQRLLFVLSSNDKNKAASSGLVLEAGNDGFWKRIFNHLEELSHMDDVRIAQERVLNIKNELRDAGDQKRVILKELDQVRSGLNNIYKEMKFVRERSSDQYMQLVKMEIDLCPKEKQLQQAFTKADEREQQLFNAFSVAITDSYEKEKVHSNFLKVLGVVGTILGSFLTLVISIIGQINHQNKFYSLRQDFENTLATQVTQKLDELNKRLEPLERIQQTASRILIAAQGQQQQHQNTESWGSYLKRHTRWIYGWAVPKH